MAKVKGKRRQLTAEQRLAALKAAEQSGNVSEACLQHGISRASYYAWLKKYEANGSVGLQPIKRTSSHPNKTPQDAVERVIDLAIRHPDSGCAKVATLLSQEGISLSPPTVQKILNKNGLGTVSSRLFRLEKLHVLDGWPVTDLQLELINSNDPCLKERNNTGAYPGEILVQDCFPIFQLIPGCYIHVVIDTYSSTAFVYPCFEKSSFIAADVLQVLVFRKFQQPDFPIKKILTSNAYIFSRHGKKYSDICIGKNILHEIITGNSRNWNGHIERFKKFFLFKFRRLKSEKLNLAQLTEIFEKMKHPAIYRKTIVNGYPNFGESPATRIQNFSQSMTQEISHSYTRTSR